MTRFFILLSLIYSMNSFAILEFEDAAFPELVTSARALALGNAYGNKVDDAWSALYNPAGLGSVRGISFHFANIHTEVNSGFNNIASGSGSFFDNTGNFSKALEPTGIRDLLVAKPGNTSHARVQVFPNITFRGITLGYLYSKQNRARLKTASSDLEIAERLDQGPILGFNLSLFGGVFKFGYSAAMLTREQLQKDFTSSDPVTISKVNDYTKGSMLYVTGGVRLTIPIFLLPTFSFVSRNAQGAIFTNPEFSGVPDPIPQTADGYFSITPYNSRISRTHIEIGVKDLTNQYKDVPAGRKIIGGIEIDWYRKMFFRLGFGDGWGSGGIGVRNNSLIFDLTSYAIELSPDGYRKEEDRRFVLSMSRGF